MKIHAKITIIVVENREPYYFIIIYKCKEFPLSLFSYQMLASTFDSDKQSSYYKVYAMSPNQDVPNQLGVLVRMALRAEENSFGLPRCTARPSPHAVSPSK